MSNNAPKVLIKPIPARIKSIGAYFVNPRALNAANMDVSNAEMDSNLTLPLTSAKLCVLRELLSLMEHAPNAILPALIAFQISTITVSLALTLEYFIRLNAELNALRGSIQKIMETIIKLSVLTALKRL